MTAAVLERPRLNVSCHLSWCMAANGCTNARDTDARDLDDGVLHYGRPSSIGSYDGDDITVKPYQWNNSVDSTGPRVEVGASKFGQHQVALTAERADEFAAAVNDAATGQLAHSVTIVSDVENDRSGYVTVHAGARMVRHDRFEYWLIKLSFFAANDGDEPVVVEALDRDAAEYAQFVGAAAAEVTR